MVKVCSLVRTFRKVKIMKELAINTVIFVCFFIGGVITADNVTRSGYCSRDMHWQTDDPIHAEFGVFMCKYCDVRVEIE